MELEHPWDSRHRVAMSGISSQELDNCIYAARKSVNPLNH